MIFIDGSRYNNTMHRTGVENYSYFLLNELAKQAPEQITIVSPRQTDLKLPHRVIPFPRLWTQARLSWEVWRKKIDNLFVPSHLMPLIHPKNTTITIHDVAFKRTPKSYGHLSRWYLNWGAKFAVKNAKNIIVPSPTTKKDLIKFYGADEKKITVIPLGFTRSNRSDGRTDYGSNSSERAIDNRALPYNLKPQSYFLFIGRIETKKNVATLINAFLKLNDPNLKLVLAGKPGVGSDEILKLTVHPNIIVTGYIGETEKTLLLKNCLAFVFPSLFEGFGIPLLEAMDAGAPIVASKIPTSYQMAKQNALFFKPHDQKALTQALHRVAMNPQLRAEMTKHHAETLKRYSWAKASKQTLEVISA